MANRGRSFGVRIFIGSGSLRGQPATAQRPTGPTRSQPLHGWGWGQKIWLFKRPRWKEIALYICVNKYAWRKDLLDRVTNLPKGRGNIPKAQKGDGFLKGQGMLNAVGHKFWGFHWRQVEKLGFYWKRICPALRANPGNSLSGLVIVGGFLTLSLLLRLPYETGISLRGQPSLTGVSSLAPTPVYISVLSIR